MAPQKQSINARSAPLPTPATPRRRREILSGGQAPPPLSDNTNGPHPTNSDPIGTITPPALPTGTNPNGPNGGTTGPDGSVTFTGSDGSITVSGPSGSMTFTGPDGSVTVSGPGGSTVLSPTGQPGSGNNGGSGVDPTSPIVGSPSGTVRGPSDRRMNLSPAAITAILLAVLLVLAILAVAGRLLWRRRQERKSSYHVETLPAGGRPGHGFSNTSFNYDPQMAERLRGGVIEPYHGAASAESLSSQYRIEPFGVPPRRPPHARTPSTTRLLDDAAAFSSSPVQMGPSTPAALLKGPRPLPRGAMNLQHHNHSFAGLTPLATPMGTPMTESDMVFEIPPTYTSLAPPRSVRRWFQFWPPSSNRTSNNNGTNGSGSNVASHGHGSGNRSIESNAANHGHGSANRSGSL